MAVEGDEDGAMREKGKRRTPVDCRGVEAAEDETLSFSVDICRASPRSTIRFLGNVSCKTELTLAAKVLLFPSKMTCFSKYVMYIVMTALKNMYLCEDKVSGPAHQARDWNQAAHTNTPAVTNALLSSNE